MQQEQAFILAVVTPERYQRGGLSVGGMERGGAPTVQDEAPLYLDSLFPKIINEMQLHYGIQIITLHHIAMKAHEYQENPSYDETGFRVAKNPGTEGNAASIYHKAMRLVGREYAALIDRVCFRNHHAPGDIAKALDALGDALSEARKIVRDA